MDNTSTVTGHASYQITGKTLYYKAQGCVRPTSRTRGVEEAHQDKQNTKALFKGEIRTVFNIVKFT